MELNGALSNPFVSNKRLLKRLSGLHDVLLKKAVASPRQPRPAPAKPTPVLETVSLVLALAGRPMRVREIHAAAGELLGRPVCWSSVKGVLSAHALGSDRRFRRLGRGIYELGV